MFYLLAVLMYFMWIEFVSYSVHTVACPNLVILLGTDFLKGEQ